MRVTKHQKQDSLHYFHSFTVRDRVDFNLLSEKFPTIQSLSPMNKIVETILPSEDDDRAMHLNFTVLISRALVENLDFFKTTFDGVVDWHISHQFQYEMSQKSEVVG